MFITQQPLFKKFWYPVIPIHNIKQGPASFVLLGTKLVLWLNELGEPCSAIDRCAHRSAQLSKGWVCEGHITCPYHGWSYNKQGKCVEFNQGSGEIPASYKNVHSELSVCVPKQQQKNTHEYLSDNQRTSTRLMDVTWTMPFNIKLSIRYPNGLHHVIINNPTPIDDDHIQVVQFCFRSDSEADISREDLIKFERQIVDEDRLVLETTDYNYPLFHEYAEVHMPTDKAGILVRKKIKKMIDRYT